MFQRQLPALFLSTAILLTTAALTSAQAPSAPGKTLPPGPMQAKVKADCTSCHNAGRITEQHFSRQQWSEELEKMEGLGAIIDDADRSAILDYLSKNFGPSKSDKPADKKARSGN